MKKKVFFLSILIILSFLLVSCKEQVVETNNTMPSTTIAPTTETNDSQTNNKVYLEVKDKIEYPSMQLDLKLADHVLINLSLTDNRIEIFDLEKQVLRLTKESYKIKNQTSIIGNNIYFFYSDFLETDIPLIRYDIDSRKFYEYNSADLGFHIINGITANSKYICVQGHENKIAKIDLFDNKVES
ncbi:MAG: hypothetical protein PHX37_01525, partial [Eubacteriales bacterium]|nr:hypothetical protein [Eubacteriales bacterium]